MDASKQVYCKVDSVSVSVPDENQPLTFVWANETIVAYLNPLGFAQWLPNLTAQIEEMIQVVNLLHCFEDTRSNHRSIYDLLWHNRRDLCDETFLFIISSDDEMSF